jgi:Tol biopolymer transport system component
MLAVTLLILQVTTGGAELMAPGVINTDADEYGPTLTPDGRGMYFTLRADRRGRENIVFTQATGTQWSKPVMAPFSGSGVDKEPYLSPDGSRLFFASRRDYPSKLPAQGEEAYDLFVVDRQGDAWGTPQPLTGANSGAYDNYPAVTRDGTVYFASHRQGGKGANDLWRSRWESGGWLPAENVSELNSPTTDADPYVAPDESYLILSSDRQGGAGQGDLYVSFRRSGTWTVPVSLGPAVNTGGYEYTPWVSADGRWLYFSRDWGEIWRIATARVPSLAEIQSTPRR